MQDLGDIWQWLNTNSGAISAIGSICTLAVWVLYFQLLLNTYRYRLRPRLLINRTGKAVEAKCIITNMSVEKIYLESVLVTLEFAGPSMTFILSEIVTDGKGRQRARYQGPLASGELLDIGSYRSIVERGLREQRASKPGCEMDELKAIIITAVATYTAEERLVASERRFDLVDAGKTISSRQYSARQVRSGRRRREIERFVVRNVA